MAIEELSSCLQHADKEKPFAEKHSLMLQQLQGKRELLSLLLQAALEDSVQAKSVLGQCLLQQPLQLSKFQHLLPQNHSVINLM